MVDALISPVVGTAMNTVSVAAAGVSVARVKKYELSEIIVPIMGVAGAMVFAGQMINFTIPATGSSGHIGGGIMMAGLLGGIPAFLSIAAVLIIQCLFFADGGLLALGCNIFNIGVIPCLIIYPLIFKPLLGSGKGKNSGAGRAGRKVGGADKAGAGDDACRADEAGEASASGEAGGYSGYGEADYKRLSVASIASAVIGLELGAFSVVLQTFFSGITALPFGTFVALMLPVHLAIGIVEGIVTAGILCFIYKMRPEIIDSAQSGERFSGVSVKNVLITLAALTIIAGGILSLFASSLPDGLEWAIGRTIGQTLGAGAEISAEGGVFESAANIQENTAFLPDYAFASDPENKAGASFSGLIGAAVTFAFAGATGFVITKVKRKKKKKKAAANA